MRSYVTLLMKSRCIPFQAELSVSPPLSPRRSRLGFMYKNALLQHLVLHQPSEMAVRFVGKFVVAPDFDHLFSLYGERYDGVNSRREHMVDTTAISH